MAGTQVYLVGARDACCSRLLGSLSTGNLDLGAFHLPRYVISLSCKLIGTICRLRSYIKLGTVRRPGAVQGDHLGAQEVLTIFDALGDLDLLVSAAVDDRVRAPDTVAPAGLLDLKPAKL